MPGVLADVLRLAVPPAACPGGGRAPPSPCPTAPRTGPRRPAGERRTGGLGAVPARARRSSTRWRGAGRRTRCGRRCPASRGRTGSPRPPPPPRRPGRGALLVVPDQRDVAALHAACAARLGERAVVALTAELGPAERYRRWLAVRRGRGAGGGGHPVGDVRARSTGPGCWPSGTTATTCTRSPARPTRTSATCWCCGRTPPVRHCWSAASPGRRRRRCWSSRGGRRRSWPTGRRCAAAARASPR